MESVNKPHAYLLRGEQRIEDILAAEAELLRTEGIDPQWPGFAKPRDDSAVDRDE